MKIREIICESETLPNENSLGKPIAHSPEALKNFWAWFKGSKVVDENKRPLVMYHGTSADFPSFGYEYADKGGRQCGGWNGDQFGAYSALAEGQAAQQCICDAETDI